MNIVKMLKKQIEAGRTVVMENGATVKPDEVNKPLMKDYLAGIKSGEISPDVSFNDYCAEHKTDLLTVQEIIDFVEGNDAEE
jgi:hypothetical protein